MNLNTSLRVSYNDILLFGLLVVLTTALRISLLLAAPFIIIALLIQLGFTFRKAVVPLISVMLVSLAISFTNGLYLKYNLLSLYYILPFLLFVFSKPAYYFPKANLFNNCLKILTALMALNDCIGLIQYIRYPDDDSFSGLYSHFSVTQNGLSIINSILFYYYFRKYQLVRHLKDLAWGVFFAISFIMGFYGGGILVLVGSLILLARHLNARKILKRAALAIAVVFFIGLMLYWVRPDTLRYNLNIINLFATRNGRQTPRKLLSYFNYIEGYTSSVKDFIFGSGPGTFNSRSAFIIGSPDYFKMPGVFKSSSKPFYFENYAYTLWNAKNTVRYQEGFMNQPFSSLLAFLGEYGLLFTVCFCVYYFRQHKTVADYATPTAGHLLVQDTYRFCSIFLVLLLIIDNYAEFPEITILLLLIMKLAELELLKSINAKPLENA